MLTFIKRTSAWVDWAALLSLLLIAPLLLFPYGALPWLAVGLWAALTVWRWAALGAPRPRVEDVPLIILLGMALLGYSISIDRALSWPRLCSILLGLIIFFTLRRALPTNRHTAWIAVGLAVLGLGLAGVGFLGVNWSQVRLLDLPALYDRLPTLIHGLPNSRAFTNQDLIGPRMLGITMGIMAPVYLPLLAWREQPWLRVLAALAFLVTAGILLLTQTLSGILALLVGIFVVLVLVSRWFWLLLPAGMAAGAGLLLWMNPVDRLTTLLSIDDLGGIAVLLRLDMWSRAWAMIRDMPFTGIGLNTFPLIQSQFYTGYIIGPEPDAHNLLLQTAVDLGLPGLIAFIGFITLWMVAVLRQVKRAAHPNQRLLLIGVAAGVGAYLGHGLIDALMLGSKPTIAVWALLGVGAALSTPQWRVHKTKPGAWVISALALPVMLGLLALASPAVVAMNLGALRAHALLAPFPTAQAAPSELEPARASLEEALRRDPGLAQAHLLLGRIASLQGEFSAAGAHYEQRVALDMLDPVGAYQPALRLRQMIAPGPPPDPAAELWQIYHAWNTRFPDRAEGYLLKSILSDQYQNNPSTAQNLLQAGIQAEALPPGLLEDLLGASSPQD